MPCYSVCSSHSVPILTQCAALEMRADICYDWLIQRAWPPKPDSSRRDFLCELEIILTQ